MIWEAAPNAVLGMKFKYHFYGIPTDTTTFWGTHVLRILTVDHTFNYIYFYICFSTSITLRIPTMSPTTNKHTVFLKNYSTLKVCPADFLLLSMCLSFNYSKCSSMKGSKA